ncbi:MAG: M1 family aminopeptidase [Rhodothermales bacterium]
MLWIIAHYELKYRFKKVSTHLYFLILAALGFFMTLAVGGAFESFNAAISGSGSALKVNSPFAVFQLISALSLIGVLITASFMGQATYRDYAAKIDPLLFTAPITKAAYLGGRFIGALIGNLYIFLGVAAGMLVGSLMPIVDPEFFGPYRVINYIHPYVTFVLPNLLFTGAIFFALAAITRKMLPNYIGGMVLLVGYLIAGQLIADLENETLAALIDPFGGQAMVQLTQYWTVAEQNTQLIPLEGLFLVNRLLWMGVGLAIFAFVYWRFEFGHPAVGGKRKKKAAPAETSAIDLGALPRVTPRTDFGAQLTQFLDMTKRAFMGIVKNVYFLAILASGMLFLLFTITQVGNIFGTETYPVTYQVLNTLSSFSLFVIIVIIFYSGELVWQERELKADQLFDTLPVPNWVPYLAKLVALVGVIALLMAILIPVGIATQAAKGYFNFELGLYIKGLFGVAMIDFILLAILSFAVQVVVNQKYIGHVIVIVFYLFVGFMGSFGLEHNLYAFASNTPIPYSDMNGYGHFVGPFTWFKMYWSALGVVLAIAAMLFWVRGKEMGWARRWALAKQRLTPGLTTGLIAGAALFVLTGGYIFYNTNILNNFQTSYESQLETANYERKYKRFEGIPQPRIVDVKVDVDLFPYKRDVLARGRYLLVNKTDSAIDSVHVQLPASAQINTLTFDGAHEQVVADDTVGYYIYRLNTPMLPGDSLGLDFDLAYRTEGFPNSGGSTAVVYNGSFVNSGIMPSLGYNAQAELSADDTRRKFDLPIKERAAPLEDTTAVYNTYIATDADWVTFETTVSTVPEQIAVAPGYLQREWEEGGRRYFHYQMDAPILNFYSYLSAEYVIERDYWLDADGDTVNIEVYYDEKHPYNVARMIDAVKKSLDYYTANFSPYQHRQVRILEFPRYASFAQAFPNTIPYSESIGFIARVDDPDEDIDYPFYVTAHEIAHQWWAHQVIGGAVQGATVLSETMSQYGALMVMEEEYGRDQMQRFLEYELDNYLQGRAFERKKELPLMRVENQQYIHYNKGSLVMYALRDYIGEDSLNLALSRYIDAVAFQEPPYTTTLELLNYIEAVTPDTLSYVLDDLFRTITLYENYVEEATYTVTPDSLFDVTLALKANKVRADTLGAETDVPMQDWIDIGIFADERVDGERREVPLYFQKHRITGDTTLTIRVAREPDRAGIDPYNKLIDRTSGDNVKRVTEAEE